MEICHPYQILGCEIYPSEKSAYFEMGGKKYSNGLSLIGYGHAIFNLDGKYESLSLDIGCIDKDLNRDGSIQFIVDGKIIAEYDIKTDESIILIQSYSPFSEGLVDIRTDLHNRWNNKNDKFSFDVVHNGKREICEMDFRGTRFDRSVQ